MDVGEGLRGRVSRCKPQVVSITFLGFKLALNGYCYYRESVKLADAFLAPPFLNAQYNFLKKKGKTGPATLFWTVKTLRPLWARLLPK